MPETAARAIRNRTLIVTLELGPNGYIDLQTIRGNIAAAIENAVSDGRITPDDDSHAALYAWHVEIGGEA